MPVSSERRRSPRWRAHRSPWHTAVLAAIGLAAALVASSAQAITGVSPAEAAAAGNLTQNPSLETASGTVPTCWKLGGYGTNSYSWSRTTTAHSGSYAEQLTISSLSSGDRKLLPAQDSGTCAPAVSPGTSYTVGAWYEQPAGTTGAPRFFAYYRTSAGVWVYWSESPRFTSSASWTQATWSTPAVPAGATNISVGFGLDEPGSVIMDDFSLAPSSSSSSSGGGAPASTGVPCPSAGAVTTWAPPGTKPLSDAQAAACVVHRPENRPGNVQYNDYVPTDAQLQAFHAAPQEHAPLTQYVTGRPGLSAPSTDDLIQWVAHKWGIPEDWIRAEMAVETWWHPTGLGDRTTVSSAWYPQFPTQAQIPGTSDVYESMGISQVRWTPNPTDFGVGTEPLRWESTAFALDFYAAVVRWYYDGDCSWCGSGYSAGQPWNSIGAWYSPTPWANSGAANYVGKVQSDLSNRVWAQAGF